MGRRSLFGIGISAALTFGVSTPAAAQHVAPEPPSVPPEMVASWSTSDDWTVEEFRGGSARWCVTTSSARTLGGETYQVFMTFGDLNEIGLISSGPIAQTTVAAFDINGGGLNMSDIHFRRAGQRYVAFNTMTSAMFRLVFEDFRHGTGAVFEINGRRYPLPMAHVTAVTEDMLGCQRHLIGLIIGDINL